MNAFLHPAHRHTISGVLLASLAIAATLLPLSGAETKGKKSSTKAKASAEATPKPKKSSEESTASSTPKSKGSSAAEKKASSPKAATTPKSSPKSKPTPKKSTKTVESPSPSKKKQEEGSAGEKEGESTTSKSDVPGQPSPPLPTRERSGNAATPAGDTETPPAGSSTPAPAPQPEAASQSSAASAPPPAAPSSTPEPDTADSKEAEDASSTVKKGKVAVAPNVSLSPEDLLGFELQPARVQNLIKSALDLARQKLTYTYGSADPANGGMDCSGAVHYLLTAQGFKDVPRDASGQYVWARKHGQFFAVVSKKADSFEFGELQPGDLLFWNGTYNVQRDPPVTHTMIYLGVQRKRAQHVMWGSSDGRTYAGKPRWGVSVFDFKMPRVDRNALEPAKADFLGYARIPGLRE